MFMTDDRKLVTSRGAEHSDEVRTHGNCKGAAHRHCVSRRCSLGHVSMVPKPQIPKPPYDTRTCEYDGTTTNVRLGDLN